MRTGLPSRLTAVALLAAGAWLGATGARAQEAAPAGQEQALAAFLKLGLPDARGAKWVQAQLADDDGDGLLLPGGREAGYSGNAWLVREEKNGTVELIVGHTRRVHARRAKDDDEPGAGTLPLVRIRAADLDGDLQKLAAALKPGGQGSRSGISVDDDYLSGDEARPAMAAGALLLCVHLQQQGRAAQAGALLRDALAFAPEPAAVLDFAVSILADDRLRQLTGEFIEKRDAAAYARAIGKLAGEFPRGWAKREAALFLARRALEQKPAPAAGDPAAQKAAALLLSLKREHVESLPTGSNWLFDAAEEAPSGPAAAFFAQRRTAFAALARLLDDHRFVALRRADLSLSSSSYFDSDTTPADRIRQQYNGLDRPLELRELAWALVQNIIPRRLRSEADDLETGRGEKVLAWFQTIAALSEDELAWSTLRQCENTNDNSFGPALGFLVRKGSAASQKLLQEVFLDPAVWSSGSGGEMHAQLEAYAAKLGPAAAAFGEKLRPVVAAAIKARNTEQTANMTSIQVSSDQRKMMDEHLKMLERQAAGELKKFDQIFKPQGLAEMLAELADATKEGSVEIWQTLQGQLAKVPWPQAEAQLFQTAPKAKDPAVRSGILSLIMQRGGREDGEKKPAAAAPPDAATRAALETLLADATPLPEPIQWAPAAESFADLAALAFVLPRLAESESGRWQEFMQKQPEFVIGWLKSHARALVAGQPAPPMPDAGRVPAGSAEAIIREVAALAPEKVLAALLAKTPDEQAAALGHLGTLAEWPPAFLGARLTITGSQTDGSAFAKEFNADRWKGRRLDETLHKEVTAAVEKAGLDGHACMVGFAPVGLLGGLKFGFQSITRGNINKAQLAQSKTPLLDGQPPPAAILASFFMPQGEGQSKPVTFACALWKNPDLTRAWREKFARPADPAAKPAPENGEAARFQQQGFPGKHNDPAPYDNAVRDLLAGKPAARGQFGLWWMARPIAETKDDEEN